MVGCSQPGARPQPVLQQPIPAKPAAENRTDPDLKGSVEQLILVLESGRPEDFSELVSREGVCLGVDCELTSLEEIKTEIQGKQGSYCELFDSICLRMELRARWRKAKKEQIEEVLSFRDMFKAGVGRDVEIQNNGSAHILIHYKDLSNGGKFGFRPEEMDFAFAKEDGNWKLTAMSAY
jgi:hypothetical protein